MAKKMKLEFKEQGFQTEAVQAICGIFNGQPYSPGLDFRIDYAAINDPRYAAMQYVDHEKNGLRNSQIEISPETILKNVQAIQQRYLIPRSDSLVSLKCKLKGIKEHLQKLAEAQKVSDTIPYNFTVEMETGTGKTYTYIKTIFELYKNFGWNKYIIVVPSVAIREGVKKTFEITREHFGINYEGLIAKTFIYDSGHPEYIYDFASDPGINVMIINWQAFHRTRISENTLRIYRKQERFRDIEPIVILRQTCPILIIDEPQSVPEDSLWQFNPLFTMRYSATPRNPYNMVYRLDALDAYQQKLVKKIQVVGVDVKGNVADTPFVELIKVNISKSDPTVDLKINYLDAKKGITQRIFEKLTVGTDLYTLSNELEVYKDNFVISDDGIASNPEQTEQLVKFRNGIEVRRGNQITNQNTQDDFATTSIIRRTQIRETIRAHFEMENKIYQEKTKKPNTDDKNELGSENKNTFLENDIKVISLFFIDRVSNYKVYSKDSAEAKGQYAIMFEQEYAKEKINFLATLGINKEYAAYLKKTEAAKAHLGYFAQDKSSGRLKDSKESAAGSEEDINAYDLIMKDKEALLDPSNPIRFIFSHSALREGWDNPNVFQICTLKESGNNIVNKRQEIGRGMRLCVDMNGRRMDALVLGDKVHAFNLLTVVASESYESFVSGLQKEMLDVICLRQLAISKSLFIGRTIINDKGFEAQIDEKTSKLIIKNLKDKEYLKEGYKINSQFSSLHKSPNPVFQDETLHKYEDAICEILEKIGKQSIIDVNSLKGQSIADKEGNTISITAKMAKDILKSLKQSTLIDKGSALSDKFFEDSEKDRLDIPDIDGIDSNQIKNILVAAVRDPSALKPVNKLDNTLIRPAIKKHKLESEAFQTVWNIIKKKIDYTITFGKDTEKKLIDALKKQLNTITVSAKRVIVTKGTQKDKIEADELKHGNTFQSTSQSIDLQNAVPVTDVKYDLVGKIVSGTTLTRKVAANALAEMDDAAFEKYKYNPEEFIQKACEIINDTTHLFLTEYKSSTTNKKDSLLTYYFTGDEYDLSIFEEQTFKEARRSEAVETPNGNICDFVITDSNVERKFVEDLEKHSANIAVYAKLPKRFKLPTPVYNYNPDWVIALKEGNTVHLYFVVETKGTKKDSELRDTEKARIHCAEIAFDMINSGIANESDKIIYKSKITNLDELWTLQEVKKK